MKISIIGCGLSGIAAACLLKDKHNITIFETRNHIGGNCYDSNLCGTLIHNYGPHTFHTNDEQVFEFLSRFTEWTPFSLKPKGKTRLGLISLPYSKKTISEIGFELNQNEIIDIIFKDYSEKQWGVPFNQIPSTITNRVPKTKDEEDPSWHNGDKYQCLPKFGYTKMFENMLSGINVILNCDKNEWQKYNSDLIIFTGRIDEYFNYCFEKLPYRSLDFVHKTSSVKMPYFIEHSNTKIENYTRKYDHSFLSLNHSGTTIITEEYPKLCNNNDIPYYPIPWGESQLIYNKYRELGSSQSNVIFLGRLATYKYLDMWMAVKKVFKKLENII